MVRRGGGPLPVQPDAPAGPCVSLTCCPAGPPPPRRPELAARCCHLGDLRFFRSFSMIEDPDAAPGERRRASYALGETVHLKWSRPEDPEGIAPLQIYAIAQDSRGHTVWVMPRWGYLWEDIVCKTDDPLRPAVPGGPDVSPDHAMRGRREVFFLAEESLLGGWPLHSPERSATSGVQPLPRFPQIP